MFSRLVKRKDHQIRVRTQSIIFDSGNYNYKYFVFTVRFMLPKMTLSYWSLKNNTLMNTGIMGLIVSLKIHMLKS